MINADLILQERHFTYLKELLLRQDGVERAAYILCGSASVEADPWDQKPLQRFISYEVLPVPADEIVSASERHITWKTNSLVRAVQKAQEQDLTVALVHSHPGGWAEFSEQDDINEPDLVELAQNRNGPNTRLLSVIMVPGCKLVGRLWVSQNKNIALRMIKVVGKSILLNYPGRGDGVSDSVFHRQSMALGEALTQDMSVLRVGIVGCGGTGSAVAMLLPKMGVRKIALFDKDTVEVSNLNRLHGANKADADKHRLKVDVVAKALSDLELGVEMRTFHYWASETQCWDALKSCDVVFGCTDDHDGRLFLNRFAYFYATPIFDIGLSMDISKDDPPQIRAMDARVTTLMPEHTCLICRGIIDSVMARDESLKRSNPTEYERRKAEAYVIGEGDPSPAVVLFTTDAASMAIQELVHRLQGFRGKDGAIAQRVRKFYLGEDRRQGSQTKTYCPICGSDGWWGKGDVEPFLDQVG